MIDSKTYRVCGNPECSFLAPYSPKPRCPRCGEPVLVTCPHCSHEVAPVPITGKGDFCEECGQRFKAAPTPRKPRSGCCTPA